MNNKEKRNCRSLRSKARAELICVGVAMICTILLGGCKKMEPEIDAAEETVEEPSRQSVQVPEEGARFDPPIAASEVPDGTWMCDMGGKVHYASQAEGDGKCPVCGMDLVQQDRGARKHGEAHIEHRMEADDHGHHQGETHGGEDGAHVGHPKAH